MKSLLGENKQNLEVIGNLKHHCADNMREPDRFFFQQYMQLMVATTLILLCTKPLEAGMFGQEPWLLTVPATAIICREVTSWIFFQLIIVSADYLISLCYQFSSTVWYLRTI